MKLKINIIIMKNLKWIEKNENNEAGRSQTFKRSGCGSGWFKRSGCGCGCGSLRMQVVAVSSGFKRFVRLVLWL